MRAAEFTDEQIIEAGKALRAEGRRISGFAIREKLGGGNSQRMKIVWDAYSASANDVPALPIPELPTEILEGVEKFVKSVSAQVSTLAHDLNEKANRVADRKLTEVLQASAEQRAQNEAEMNDASKIIESLEATNAALKSDCAEKSATIIQVQAMAQAQAVELAQVKERLSAAEQAAAAERLHYRADLAALAEAQKEASKAREDAAKLQGRLEAIEAQNAELMRVLSSRSEPAPVEQKPKK